MNDCDENIVTMNEEPPTQKLLTLKDGNILRYKKRLFGSNWRETQLTLFNNGTFLISTPQSQLMITCEKKSTLIIFGQQLKLVPKRPEPPAGYQIEQMLAIGLINHNYSTSGRLKGTQIIFYWFLSPSVNDLLEWIIAFQNSLVMPVIDEKLNNPSYDGRRDEEREYYEMMERRQRAEHENKIERTRHQTTDSLFGGITCGIMAGVAANVASGGLDPGLITRPLVEIPQQLQFGSTLAGAAAAAAATEISYRNDLQPSATNQHLLAADLAGYYGDDQAQQMAAYNQLNPLPSYSGSDSIHPTYYDSSGNHINDIDFENHCEYFDTVADFSALNIY